MSRLERGAVGRLILVVNLRPTDEMSRIAARATRSRLHILIAHVRSTLESQKRSAVPA